MQIRMYIQFSVHAQWATVSCAVLLLSWRIDVHYTKESSCLARQRINAKTWTYFSKMSQQTFQVKWCKHPKDNHYLSKVCCENLSTYLITSLHTHSSFLFCPIRTIFIYKIFWNWEPHKGQHWIYSTHDGGPSWSLHLLWQTWQAWYFFQHSHDHKICRVMTGHTLRDFSAWAFPTLHCLSIHWSLRWNKHTQTNIHTHYTYLKF